MPQSSNIVVDPKHGQHKQGLDIGQPDLQLYAWQLGKQGLDIGQPDLQLYAWQLRELTMLITPVDEVQIPILS